MTRAGLTFRALDDDDCRALYDWRVEPRIADYMTQTPPSDYEAHCTWFEAQKDSDERIYWIIERAGDAAGLMSLEWRDKSAGLITWGYYIGDDTALGLGALIPPMLYNACFEIPAVMSILAEVHSNNIQVLKLHQNHGYSVDALMKKDDWRGTPLVLLVLEKSKWLEQTRYHKLRGSFPGLKNFLTT